MSRVGRGRADWALTWTRPKSGRRTHKAGHPACGCGKRAAWRGAPGVAGIPRLSLLRFGCCCLRATAHQRSRRAALLLAASKERTAWPRPRSLKAAAAREKPSARVLCLVCSRGKSPTAAAARARCKQALTVVPRCHGTAAHCCSRSMSSRRGCKRRQQPEAHRGASSGAPARGCLLAPPHSAGLTGATPRRLLQGDGCRRTRRRARGGRARALERRGSRLPARGWRRWCVTPSSLAGSTPFTPRLATAGLYFLCLSKAQKTLEQGWPKDSEGKPTLPALRTFTLGAVSRATAAIVFCPITVVKTRMVRNLCGACGRLSYHRSDRRRNTAAQEYAAISGVVYRNTAHALYTIAKQARCARARRTGKRR